MNTLKLYRFSSPIQLQPLADNPNTTSEEGSLYYSSTEGALRVRQEESWENLATIRYVDAQEFGADNVYMTYGNVLGEKAVDDIIRWNGTAWQNAMAVQYADGTANAIMATSEDGLLDPTFLWKNIDMNFYTFYNIPDPLYAEDVSNKNYVDNQWFGDNNVFIMPHPETLQPYNNDLVRWDAGSQLWRNVAAVQEAEEIPTYQDEIISTNSVGRLDKSFLWYDLDRTGYRIYGLPSPVGESDAATKGYVDGIDSSLRAYTDTKHSAALAYTDYFHAAAIGHTNSKYDAAIAYTNTKHDAAIAHTNTKHDAAITYTDGKHDIAITYTNTKHTAAINYIDAQPFSAANVRFKDLTEGDLILYEKTTNANGDIEAYWTNISSLRLTATKIEIFDGTIVYETNVDQSTSTTVNNKFETFDNSSTVNNNSFNFIDKSTHNIKVENKFVEEKKSYVTNNNTHHHSYNITNEFKTEYNTVHQNVTKNGVFITEDKRTFNDYGEKTINNHNQYINNENSYYTTQNTYVDNSTKFITEEHKTVQIGTFDYSTKNTFSTTVQDYSTNHNYDVDNSVTNITNDNRTVYETNNTTQIGTFFYGSKHVTENIGTKVVNEDNRTINNSNHITVNKTEVIQQDVKNITYAEHHTHEHYHEILPTPQKPGSMAIEGKDSTGRPKAGIRVDTDGGMRNHAKSFRKAAGKNDPESTSLHLVNIFDTDLRIMKNGTGYVSAASFDVTTFTGSKIEYRLKDRATGHSRIGTLYISAQVPDVTYASHEVQTSEYDFLGSSLFYGQTFTSTYSGMVSTIEIWLRRAANTTGSLQIGIYELGGTGLPKPQPLTLSEPLNIATEISETGGTELFVLTTGVNVEADKQYAIALRSIGSISGGKVFVGKNTNSYNGGETIRSNNSGSSWIKLSNEDLYFKVRGPQPSVNTTSSFSDFYAETGEMDVNWNTEVVSGQVKLQYSNSGNDKWMHIDATYFPH